MEVDVAGIHKILAKGLNKKGKVNVQSFTGHMSSLSAPQRDHIKYCGNLKGFLQRYPKIYKLKNGSVSLLTSNNNEITNMKPSNNYEGAMADDRCAICTEIIEVHAAVECGHTLCYKCAVRWRVINKENDCMYCKQKLTKIIFCNSEDDIPEPEDLLEGEYGFYYECTKIQTKVESLLKHSCNKCTSKFDDCKSLDQHLQEDHGLSFCDICIRYQKFFSSEREIYTLDEILPHHKEEHKLCPYCDVYYFDKDDLFHHLTNHHSNCQICNSNTADDEEHNLLYYFRSMEELSEHIQEEHVYCKYCIHDSPQESAFEGEKDLMAHMNYKHRKKKKFSKYDIDIHMNTRQESMMNNATPMHLPTGLTHSKIKPTDATDSIGQITGSLNPGYSFIQPHGCQDRSKNVYFDTDSFGISANEDLRDHFDWGDYVRFSSVEHQGHSAGYRAINVTKISSTEYFKEVEKRTNTHTADYIIPQTTNLDNQEFPGITTTFSKHTNAAVWPAVKRSTITKPSPLDMRNPTPSKNAPFGYAYNIKPRFGFISRRPGRSEHDKNVYFNIQAFNNGLIMPQTVTSLEKCISDGVKLYYELEDKRSTNQSHDTKLRAKKVWRAVLNSAPSAPPLKISVTQNQKPKVTEKASKKKMQDKISTKDELQMLDFRDDNATNSSSTLSNDKKTSNTNTDEQDKFERSYTPRKNSKTNSMDDSIGDVRLISESGSVVVYENITADSQSTSQLSVSHHDANSQAFNEPTTTQYNGQDSIYLQNNSLEIYGESSQLIAEILANGNSSDGDKKNKLTVPFMEVYESDDEALSHAVAEQLFGNNSNAQTYSDPDLPTLIPNESHAPEDSTNNSSPPRVHSPMEVKIVHENDFTDKQEYLHDKLTMTDEVMTQQTAEQKKDESPLAVDEEDKCNKEERLPSLNPTSLHDDYGSLSQIPVEEVVRDVGSLFSLSSPHEDNSTADVRRITPQVHDHETNTPAANEDKDDERKIFEKNVLQKLAKQMTDNFSNKSLQDSEPEVSISSSEESCGLTRSSENLPQAELSLHPMGDEFTEEELLVIDQMQQVEQDGKDVKAEEKNSNSPEVRSRSKGSSGYCSNGANSNGTAETPTHDQGDGTNASITPSVKKNLMNETINGRRSSKGSSSSGSYDNDDGSSSDDVHAVITAVSDGSSSHDDGSVETDDSDRVPTTKKNRRKLLFENDSKYFSIVLETLLGKKGLRKLKEVLFDKYLFFNDLCFVSIDSDANEVFYRYYKNAKGSVQLSSRKKMSTVFSLNVDSAINGLISRGLITKCDESTFCINKTFHYMIGKVDKDGHISKLTVHYRSLCKRN